MFEILIKTSKSGRKDSQAVVQKGKCYLKEICFPFCVLQVYVFSCSFCPEHMSFLILPEFTFFLFQQDASPALSSNESACDNTSLQEASTLVLQLAKEDV